MQAEGGYTAGSQCVISFVTTAGGWHHHDVRLINGLKDIL